MLTLPSHVLLWELCIKLSIVFNDNDDVMNLYSAKTIEEYSKALYIKLKLMNKK